VKNGADLALNSPILEKIHNLTFALQPLERFITNGSNCLADILCDKDLINPSFATKIHAGFGPKYTSQILGRLPLKYYTFYYRVLLHGIRTADLFNTAFI
jgi:hypothetical protein